MILQTFKSCHLEVESDYPDFFVRHRIIRKHANDFRILSLDSTDSLSYKRNEHALSLAPSFLNLTQLHLHAPALRELFPRFLDNEYHDESMEPTEDEEYELLEGFKTLAMRITAVTFISYGTESLLPHLLPLFRNLVNLTLSPEYGDCILHNATLEEMGKLSSLSRLKLEVGQEVSFEKSGNALPTIPPLSLQHFHATFVPYQLFEYIWTMPFLETLVLHFDSSVSIKDGQLDKTFGTLPALRFLEFSSTSEQIHTLVPLFSASPLQRIDITYLHASLDSHLSSTLFQNFSSTLQLVRFCRRDISTGEYHSHPFLVESANSIRANKPFPQTSVQHAIKWSGLKSFSSSDSTSTAEVTEGEMDLVRKAVLETTTFPADLARRAAAQGDDVMIGEIAKGLDVLRGLQALDKD